MTLRARVRVAVPAKALGRGKSRLSGILGARERRALNAFFLRRTLATARRAAPGRVLAVSDGADALALARALGADALAAPGRGLNRALGRALRAARAGGAAALLVLPADLPFLSPADVRLLLAAGARRGAAPIARDRAGHGTNALLVPAVRAFRFRFGADSAAAHEREARRRGLRPVFVDRPGLAFDVDIPADYAAFAARRK